MEQFAYKYQTLPDGARLGYIDEGKGTPLVMMHGWTGTAQRHFDLAEWREAIMANHGVEQLVPLITGRLEAMPATLAVGGDIGLSRAHLIACPTLLLYGQEEERGHAQEVAQLAAHIPNCRLEIIADSDHVIQKEQPERFMRVVRSFLSQLS